MGEEPPGLAGGPDTSFVYSLEVNLHQSVKNGAVITKCTASGIVTGVAIDILSKQINLKFVNRLIKKISGKVLTKIN